MSVNVYRLMHMFGGVIKKDDDDTAREHVFFTRDNEHLLGQLVEPSIEEAVAKGWVEVTAVPTMRDLKERQTEARRVAKDGKRGGSTK